MIAIALLLATSAQAHEAEGGHVPEQDLCTAEAIERLATETNHDYGAGSSMVTSHSLLAVDELDREGALLHPGDKVRTTGRAGTLKPWSTGHEHEVILDAGKTGTVACFTDSQIGRFSNQLAVIRWDLQVWSDQGGPHDKQVLQPFESTINPSYLEVLSCVKASETPDKTVPSTPPAQ